MRHRQVLLWTRSHWRGVLDTAASLAICALALSMVVSKVAGGPSRPGPSLPKIPAAPLDIGGVPLEGVPRASGILIEYADFQCPYCKRWAADVLPTLQSKYVNAGLVRFGFRHLPLRAIHPYAMDAAKAAACAGRDAHFWRMYELLFEMPEDLSPSGLASKARDAGLQRETFETCMADTSAQVESDMKSATLLNISATPTFVLGHAQGASLHVENILVGNKTLQEFEQVLDHLTSGRQ